MNLPFPSSARGSAIFDEHVRLREMLANFRHMLLMREASPQVVAGTLNELVENVLDHFEHEELGGYFSEALESEPRLADQVKYLLQQHSEMATQIAELKKLVGRPMHAMWWNTLGAKYLSFLRRFEAHEAEENSLLHDALNGDLGTED